MATIELKSKDLFMDYTLPRFNDWIEMGKGIYEIEQVKNPRDSHGADWFVFKGTTIGATMMYFGARNVILKGDLKETKYKLILPFDMPLLVYGPKVSVFKTLRTGEYTLVERPNPRDPESTPWLVVQGIGLGMSSSAWFGNRDGQDMPFYGMKISEIK